MVNGYVSITHCTQLDLMVLIHAPSPFKRILMVSQKKKEKRILMSCATYTLNYYNGSVLLEHLLIENF